MSNWKQHIGNFSLNDSDDEMLQQFEEDVLWVDMDKVVAFYPSKDPKFIKLDLNGNYMYAVKSTIDEIKKQIGI